MGSDTPETTPLQPPRPTIDPLLAAREAEIRRREERLAQRERELQEQRRVLSEEYRLLRGTPPPSRAAMAPMTSQGVPMPGSPLAASPKIAGAAACSGRNIEKDAFG